MAKDRPSPYGNGNGYLIPYTKNARCPEAADVFYDVRSMARDRPSPYVGRGVSSVLSPAMLFLNRPEEAFPVTQKSVGDPGPNPENRDNLENPAPNPANPENPAPDN